MSLKKILLLAGLVMALASCIKEPVDEDQSTSAEDVYSSLSGAWGTADPLTMQEKDFLFQETEQKLENNPEPFFVLQEGINILKKEETSSKFIYTFLYQTKDYKQGQEGPQSTRESYREVKKADPAVVAATQALSAKSGIKPYAGDYEMTLGIERLMGLAYACVKTDALDKYCKENLGMDSCEIQCANLKVEEETRPLPDLIKARPNCGGFTDCKYQVKNVKFDWIIDLKKGDGTQRERVNYSISMSPDMPFLSRVTEYCFRQLYPVQNQKVLVTTCTKLKDFKKGGD